MSNRGWSIQERADELEFFLEVTPSRAIDTPDWQGGEQYPIWIQLVHLTRTPFFAGPVDRRVEGGGS